MLEKKFFSKNEKIKKIFFSSKKIEKIKKGNKKNKIKIKVVKIYQKKKNRIIKKSKILI